MKTLQYLFVVGMIAGAILFLAPFVGSEPVRVDAALPQKTAMYSWYGIQHRKQTTPPLYWNALPVTTTGNYLKLLPLPATGRETTSIRNMIKILITPFPGTV